MEFILTLFKRRFSWTGYKNMKNLPLLLDAICEAYNNPSFLPREGKTYCNMASNSIALKMGCGDLAGRVANDIYDYMSASPNWSETPFDKAQFLANQGTLVFAARKDSPHGHICVVMPGNEKFSGKWGKVPTVMNIGKDVFIGKGVSWAFSELPKFYSWRPSL